MRFAPRRHLPHAVPPWVRTGALFFITIHCRVRERAQLTSSNVAGQLIETVRHYHLVHRWHARLFLVMPDHVHGLLAFAAAAAMTRTMTDWKRYTARQCGIEWQRDYFDHRLRSAESWQLRADYIRANPVRKGLVAKADDWPWVFEA